MKNIFIAICVVISYSGLGQCLPAAPTDSLYSFLPLLERRVQLSWQDGITYHYSSLPVSWFKQGLNAKDVGAIGDGTTDNTTNIQAAINWLSARSGGILFFPIGTYITRTLLIPANVILQGENRNGMTLKLKNGTNADLLDFFNADAAGVTDMTLDGNNANNTSGDVIALKGNVGGIPAGRCRYLKIRDITISNGARNGIYGYGQAWAYLISKIRVQGCNGYGIYSVASDAYYGDIEAQENKLGGIYEGGGNMHYYNVKSFYNSWGNTAGAGIEVHTAQRIVMTNIETQDNYYNGFLIDSAADIALVGAMADGNGAAYRPYSGGNRNHPEVYDTVTVSYGYQVIASQQISIEGMATNYISPTGQHNDHQFINNKNITYQVTVSNHLLPAVETGNVNVSRTTNAMRRFNKADIFTGNVSDDQWRRIYSFKSDSTSSSDVRYSIAGTIIIGNSFGINTIGSYPFQVTYRGKSVANATDAVVLYLQGFPEDRVRIVKKATNNYELQIKSISGVLTGYELYNTGNTSAGVNAGSWDINHTLAGGGDVALYNYLTATANPAQTTSADIEITDATKGVILKSPNGTRWRITIDNTGTLIRTSL